MIQGHMTSELVGNARIWTLTVTEQPTPGALVEWDEPGIGFLSPRSGIRGWVSGDQTYNYDDTTVVFSVVGEGERWVRIVVEADEDPATYSDSDESIQARVDAAKAQQVAALRSARTADSLLTALAAMRYRTDGERKAALRGCNSKLLYKAADLCGVDADPDFMTKGQAIAAIIESF